MENNRFVVLTGHLNDYPLSDLVGILRHQQKTGRLLIEYPKGPASLFFKTGELVDAQLGSLGGLQAVCVMLAEPPSPFNFNPLVPAARRSIDHSLQRAVSELLGCWDESTVLLEGAVTEKALPRTEPRAIPALTASSGTEPTELALLRPPELPQPRQPTNRTVLLVAAAGLVLAGLSTVIAVTGSFRRGVEGGPQTQSTTNREISAPQPVADSTASSVQLRRTPRGQAGATRGKEVTPVVTHSETVGDSKAGQQLASGQPAAQADTRNDKNEKTATEAQSVSVVMQVENGRVLNASVAGHKPGMDSYEALALRIARQRRFPGTAKGQETVRITVKQPD
jgi:hypothetical protein